MTDREETIRSLVTSYYADDEDATPSMIEEAIEKVLKNTLDTEQPISEIKLFLDREFARKKILKNLRKEHYKATKIIEDVAERIGRVPDRVIEDTIISLIGQGESLTSEELIKQSVEVFKVYRKEKTEINHELPKQIEQVLNSKEVKDILTNILSNPETAREHNSISIDGAYLAANILKTRAVVGFITNYMVIHREVYNIDTIYSILNNTDVNSMTNEELNDFFCDLIVESVQQRLGLENVTSDDNKRKIAEFVYTNFIENGYCYQGTNSRFKQDIEEKGLSTEFSKTKDLQLHVVNDIFKKHGLHKIFYSKLSETKESAYYYTTDGMENAFHYSYHNPEYFSYFVAAGNNMPDNLYDRTAYFLRNYKGCKTNLEKLCQYYKLTEEEQTIVMTTFETLAAEFINDGDNTIVFVSRSLLNQDTIPFDFSSIESRDIRSIVKEITKNVGGSVGTKQNVSIPAENIDCISVPSLSKLYDASKLANENKKKYIFLEDGSKYYYDILINADKIDYDCISIGPGNPSLISLRTKEFSKQNNLTIDIITCPEDIAPDTLISNGSPSFQSLQMMIAVNGKANSPEGKKLIEESRKNYSPQYMSDYYYHLCELCCRIASDKTAPTMARYQAIIRMAKDFYPKAELMRITGEYPQFISEDSHLYEYLPSYEFYQFKTIEKAKNKSGAATEDTALEKCAEWFSANLEGKIDRVFTPEFQAKTELYGTMQLLDFSKENIESSSSDELSSMFEQQNVTQSSLNGEESTIQAEKPKIMQKKQEVPPPSGTSSDNEGFSSLTGLIMIILAIIIFLLFIMIT